MLRAALHNLGCKVNAYETEAMKQQLEERGYEIVPFDQKADVYVINTCSVTNIADRKSRQMIHRAKKQNPSAIVVAAGCYVQVAADSLKEDGSLDIIIGNNNKGRLADILEEYRRNSEKEKGERKIERENGGRAKCQEVQVLDIAHTEEYEHLHVGRLGDHTRAFIKVQDGCNQFCSYCIIPYARGRVRSREAEDVAEEITELVSKGYKEVVLTGIHLSSYGTEHMEGSPVKGGDWDSGPLWELIWRIHQIPGLERIRLGSLEPRIITREFAAKLASLPKFCPHFHLSLQSGCDSTLKRMNRHYTTEDYLNRCAILREAFEAPAITTDVIAGFPGETQEEFDLTREFLEKVHFYEMHVFKYSRREGTKAAAMKEQIPESVKGERSDVLLELERSMSLEYRKRFLDQRVSVLFEEAVEIDGTSYMVGYTPQYVKTAVPLDGCEETRLSGQIVTVQAKGLLKEDLLLAELL